MPRRRSHEVTVEPSGLVLRVGEDETLLDAAFRAGQSWPTSCYGQAQCTRCRVEILDGGQTLDPPSANERSVIDRLSALWPGRLNHEIRLACRLRPRGDLVVRHDQVILAEGRGSAAEAATPTATAETSPGRSPDGSW